MKEKMLENICNILTDCYLENLSSDIFYENVVSIFKEKYKKSFEYDTGATKGVLMFRDLGFVIKIPFTGDGEYDFYGSGYGDGWDYCQTEEKRFEFAKIEGVEQCFLETKFLTYINNYPIYVQDYIKDIGDECNSSNHTDIERTKMKSTCEEKGYYCFNSNWLLNAYQYYGEDKFYKLLRFIDDYDIDDLHFNNLGYKGKQPLIVDYASFND